MKFFINTDLEGATGVFKFRQTKERGTPEFYSAMKLLMGDVAAVAEGLKQAGATEIIALDGHNGGNNFIPECMVQGVKYVTGKPRDHACWGLDESFDGVILLGFHAMNGTPDGVLHHTQSSTAERKYWYDGTERGEIFQSSVVAGHFNVPVIMVTGDEAACREARATLGDNLTTVAVKKGISREAAMLMPPEDTRPMLIEGAKKAAASAHERRPLKPQFPLKLKMRWIDAHNQNPDSPYFIERETTVENGLDIRTGTLNADQ